MATGWGLSVYGLEIWGDLAAEAPMKRILDELIHSLNPTLALLIAQKIKEASKAIVSTEGSGNYTTLQEAISAGEKYILLKDGEYTIDADITLSDHVIIGESINGTILNITNNSSITFDNTGDAIYEVYQPVVGQRKKIKAINNSSEIQSAETDDAGFNAVTQEDSTHLFYSKNLSKVTTISNTNSLNTRNKFQGKQQDRTPADIEYSPFTLGNYNSEGTIISNLTINHFCSENTNCIEIYGHNHILKDLYIFSIQNFSTFISITNDFTNKKITSKLLIENCEFEGGVTGIEADYFYMSKIKNCNFINLEDTCIKSTTGNAYSIKITGCNFTQSENAINFNSKEIVVENNNFISIKNECIEINTSGSGEESKNKIKYNFFKYSGDSGDSCITTGYSSTEITCNSFFETGRAIYLNSNSCKDTIIQGNIFESPLNSVGTINIKGTYNRITANQFISCFRPITSQGYKTTINANQFTNCNIIIDFIEELTFYSNIITNTTFTTFLTSGNKAKIIGNVFQRSRIQFNTNRSMIKANRFLDDPTTSEIALSINGDRNLFSSNIIDTYDNGISISAGDKNHILENQFINITASKIIDSGTNTVNLNNT